MRQNLIIAEQMGYKYSEKNVLGRTRKYLTHPDGQTLAYFDFLDEILPGDLSDGEYFDLGWNALPDTDNKGNDVKYVGVGAEVQEYLPSGSLPEYDAEGNLILPWYAICLIIFAVSIVAMAIITMITNLIQKINAPCGINGSEFVIDTCWKMIIAPDCSKAEYNACAGEDLNGDGHPDGVLGDFTKDIWDPTEIVKWAVIGAVAIAGVYIAATLIPKIFKEKQQQPQYYQPPPQYQQPPDYVR